MHEVADPVVAVLDANVLFPFRVRDCLLRFAEAGLYRVRWSPQIVDEWACNLIKSRPHMEGSIRSQQDAMARAFPEAMIEGHEDLMPALELPDGNDRHVLAAAIRAGAQYVITENIRDFPKEALATYGIEAVSADRFLSSTYELYPSEATAALGRMRRSYRNPPMTPGEFIRDLMRVGLPLTAALARREIDVH